MKQYYTVLILQKNRRWNRQNSFLLQKLYINVWTVLSITHPIHTPVLGTVTVHGHNSYFSVWSHSVFFRSKVWTDIIFHLLLLMNKNLNCVEADDMFWQLRTAHRAVFGLFPLPEKSVLPELLCSHQPTPVKLYRWSCAGLVWCTCCCFLFVSWPVVSRLQRHTQTDFSHNIRSVCKSHSTEFV